MRFKQQEQQQNQMFTSTICWILVQLHRRKVFHPDLLLSYHDEIMRSWCGKKISAKVKPRRKDCEEQAYLHVHSEAATASGYKPCAMMFPCQPTSEATSEISCYLGNRWEAKGYAAGRVNHEVKASVLLLERASSDTFNILQPKAEH